MAEKIETAAVTKTLTGSVQGKARFIVKAKTPISGCVYGVRIRQGLGETNNPALAAELRTKGYEVSENK